MKKIKFKEDKTLIIQYLKRERNKRNKFSNKLLIHL